jgi:hypothetical protein
VTVGSTRVHCTSGSWARPCPRPVGPVPVGGGRGAVAVRHLGAEMRVTSGCAQVKAQGPPSPYWPSDLKSLARRIPFPEHASMEQRSLHPSLHPLSELCSWRISCHGASHGPSPTSAFRVSKNERYGASALQLTWPSGSPFAPKLVRSASVAPLPPRPTGASSHPTPEHPVPPTDTPPPC